MTFLKKTTLFCQLFRVKQYLTMAHAVFFISSHYIKIIYLGKTKKLMTVNVVKLNK